MHQTQTLNQNNSEASDLIGVQSKFLDDLAAPLRPHQQSYLDQCAELGRVQEQSIRRIMR